MSVRIQDFNIPDALYKRIKERAERKHHTLEDELVEALTAGVAKDEEDRIPADITNEMSSLEQASDEALWQAARSHLPLDVSDEIEELHLKGQREGLNTAEKQQLAGMMHQYERYMLIRAKAAALLKRRGYDVDVLLEEP
jgi:plasmid stability protein